jgi:hypothetical protein
MWPKLKAYVRVHRVNDAVEIAVILQSRFRQVQITNVGNRRGFAFVASDMAALLSRRDVRRHGVSRRAEVNSQWTCACLCLGPCFFPWCFEALPPGPGLGFLGSMAVSV